jgi:hypothetical protein
VPPIVSLVSINFPETQRALHDSCKHPKVNLLRWDSSGKRSVQLVTNVLLPLLNQCKLGVMSARLAYVC